MEKRTTLTLPSSALDQAEQIANRRHVTLSTVVAEALEDGLAIASRTRRAEEVLAAYKRHSAAIRAADRFDSTPARKVGWPATARRPGRDVAKVIPDQA